jgi:hypothetical protein
MQLGAQITLRGPDLPASLDVPFNEMMDFKSDVLEAVWWTPPGGDASIILGNSSGHSILIDATFLGREPRTIQILPHGTEVVHLSVTSPARVESARFTTHGDMASLRATGFVRSQQSHYISSVRFYDPASAINSDLFATNLRTEGTDIHLVLRNTSDVKISATPRFLTVAGESGSPKQLPAIEIPPRQNAEVDLSGFQKALAGRKDAQAVSVQFLATVGPVN